MTAFYDSLKLTADTLIDDKGQACTINVVTPGAYDAATGTSTATTVSTAVTAAIFDFPQGLIDGTLIRQGDKKVLMSAYGHSVTPRPADTLTDAAGTVYTIVTAKATAPGGTVVLWTLQVRSA